ncbi:MAG: hypothetical protein LBV13_06240 [Methanomassiliicoccaceae archaeon]|nr:hypothetical protein [Methanomassiliicoccaceae archaeon]
MKQISYNTVGTVVSLFCQWMIMMIIPRITDFSDAGVFAVALSICSVLNIFATFNLNQHQISDQYRNFTENDYRATRVMTISLSFILIAVVVLFFNYSAEQNLVIIMYMVYRNMLHYAYLHTATLQIRERLDHVGKCMMLEGAVSFASFTASYCITGDLVLSVAVMALLGGGTFLLTVAHGYMRTTGRRYPWQRAEKAKVSSLIRIGIPLLLSIVAPIIITAIPRIILQATDGDVITGIFGTLAAPTIIIPTLVMGIFAPLIVYFSNISRKRDMPLLRKQYLKMVGVVLMLGIIGYVLSRLAAGTLFELAYGDEIVPYVRYFDILIFGISLYSIGMWGITVLITKEQWKAAASASAASLAIALIVFLIAIPEYGMHGATYGLLVAYAVFGTIISLCVLLIPLRGTIGTGEAV